MKHLYRLFCISLIVVPTSMAGRENCDSLVAKIDTVANKRNIIEKVYDYFTTANVEHRDRKFDISFIGGPHYSQEAGVGLGIIGSGRYYHRYEGDSITPYSNVSLKFDVSTNGFYEVGAEGYHIFPYDKFRINYYITFDYASDLFWGIGYDKNVDDANETKYNLLQSKVKADILFNLSDKIFIGQRLQLDFADSHDMRKPELLDGQERCVRSFGLGLVFLLDTRDYPTAPEHGVYMQLSQTFHPRMAGCHYKFSVTGLRFSTYNRLWHGATLATLLHARLTYGNTPWCFLSTIGGSKIMRGYYEGRYRDKNVVDATVELRQRVWRRNGIVLWGGAAILFPETSAISMRKLLPNYGIGYRWEFKKHVNVRLDLGFGKAQKGVNFSINEAF